MRSILIGVAIAATVSIAPAQAQVCRNLPTWKECYACGASKYGAAAQAKHCAGLPGTPKGYKYDPNAARYR
jgi:hypothetical protein